MKKLFTVYFDDEDSDLELTEDMGSVVVKPEAAVKELSAKTEAEVCKILATIFASRKQTIEVIAARSGEGN